MQQLDLVIHNATGLHARPARVFVDLAKRFQSTIKVSNGTKQVNAKSLIAVLTLGVAHGQHIFVEVSGEDEQEAAETIARAVQEGLGEGAEHEQSAVAEKAEPEPVKVPSEVPVQAEIAPSSVQQAPASGKQIRGVAGAPGIAVGPIFRFERARYEVNERFAQEVRNHLIFLLNGGAGQPANPAYRLNLSVTRSVVAAVRVQSGGIHEPTAGNVQLTGRYTLVDAATGATVAQGTQQATASFDRPRQEFAVVRAIEDAENRAARELAEFIRLSLAQDLIRLSGE